MSEVGARQKITANYVIREALPKDAPAICKLRRKVWLATYPSVEHNITREILLKVFDFDSKSTIRHYHQLILGEKTGFDPENTKNCAVDPKKGYEVEKFWVAEQGKKSMRKLVAYASANWHSNILTTIYVDPAQQGQGIGQELFAKIDNFLDPKRPIGLRVVSYNQKAIDFYQRRAFVRGESQEVDIEQGRLFPSLVMNRPPQE